MKHLVEQRALEIGGPLPDPTQADICSEPIFRRATASFVRGQGGDIARLFLNLLEDLGMITDKSRLMCQRSLFVKGAFPSPPNWHLDYMPGTPNVFAQHISKPTRGAIVNACSLGKVSATTFLAEGVVQLDEPDPNVPSVTGGEYLEATTGRLNWCTPQINGLIASQRIGTRSIEPNLVYLYNSTNFHKAPQFTESGGYRIILKANTPPTDFPYAIPSRDELLSHPDFFFTLSGNEWTKAAKDD